MNYASFLDPAVLPHGGTGCVPRHCRKLAAPPPLAGAVLASLFSRISKRIIREKNAGAQSCQLGACLCTWHGATAQHGTRLQRDAQCAAGGLALRRACPPLQPDAYTGRAHFRCGAHARRGRAARPLARRPRRRPHNEPWFSRTGVCLNPHAAAMVIHAFPASRLLLDPKGRVY